MPTPNRRRQLVLGGSAALLSSPMALAQRPPTPAQSVGPFYPVIPPLHRDNDLTQVEGQARRAFQAAAARRVGTRSRPGGKVFSDVRHRARTRAGGAVRQRDVYCVMRWHHDAIASNEARHANHHRYRE